MSGEISYRGIIQNSRNLSWVLDSQGKFIIFNKRSQEVSGYRLRDIVGRSFAELAYPPEDLARIQKIYSAVMEGRLLQYELTLIKAGGELLYLMVSTSPVYDVNGCIIGTLSFGQDVTDQAHQEAALKDYQRHLEELLTRHDLDLNESNERLRREIVESTRAKQGAEKIKEHYRALVEGSSDWVWETDAEFKYTYASPRVVDILGYAPEEVVGQTPLDLMPPDEVKRVEIEGLPVMRLRLPLQGFQSRHLHKDGHVVMIETNGLPIFDEKGAFCGYRGIDRDITTRHAADQLKDEFISLVSHELKTPLTVIIGGLSTLLTGGEQLSRGERKMLTSDSYLEARKLAGTLDNLLQLSRARAGRLVLHEHPTNVGVILREIVRESKARYPQHRFLVRCPRSMDIKTDQTCLERVVTNLVDNAAKYSSPGNTVTIKVDVASDRIVFGVSDQGEGIPVDKQAKLFSLFERLGRERIEGDRGTGVGLAVCKLLVQASGGKIWLDSEAGKGSTFYFSLPRRD